MTVPGAAEMMAYQRKRLKGLWDAKGRSSHLANGVTSGDVANVVSVLRLYGTAVKAW